MYSHVLVVGQHLRLSLRQPRQSHRSQHRRLRGDANGRRKILNEKKKKESQLLIQSLDVHKQIFLNSIFKLPKTKKELQVKFNSKFRFDFMHDKFFLLFSFDKKSRTQFLIELYFCMS